MQRFVRNKRQIIVACAEDAETATDRGARALLVGQAVFVSMDPSIEPPAGFIQAAPILSFGQAKQLRRYIQEDVIAHLHDIPVAFAVDAYMAWGKRQKHDVVLLLGGGALQDSVNLELYIFDRGVLRQLVERSLPQQSAAHFHEVLSATVQEFQARFPVSRVVVAPPLPLFPYLPASTERLDDDLLGHLWYFPVRSYLSSKQARLSAANRKTGKNLFGKTAAAGVLLLSMAIAGALDGWSWMKLKHAGEAFDHASALPSVQKAGGIDNALLSHLDAHRKMLITPPAHKSQVDLMGALLKGISSIPGMRIKMLQITPSFRMAGNGSYHRAELEVMMLPESAMNQVEQGKVVATQLADATGLGFRINPSGLLASGEKADYRTWHLEVE